MNLVSEKKETIKEMNNQFFEHSILNSPYDYSNRHWELDDSGQPTQQFIESRRRAEFITPIPKPRKRKETAEQSQLLFDEGMGLSLEEPQYDHTAIINGVRQQVDKWRALPNQNDWHVTPETARLLQHWRHHNFSSICPFFCQVETVETSIWLTEVAPNAGKTIDISTLIARQTINAVHKPQSKRFLRGFLIVSPGLTIRDRLRVLSPNAQDSYYLSRELIPGDMMSDLERAQLVITNYHIFKLRERMELSNGGRSLLQDRGDSLNTLETERQNGCITLFVASRGKIKMDSAGLN